MEIQKNSLDYYENALKHLPVHKVGKFDVVSRDGKIKLKESFLRLYQIYKESLSSEDMATQVALHEESYMRLHDVYKLFSEQITRLCSYKGISTEEILSTFESIYGMFCDSLIKIEGDDKEMCAYSKYLVNSVKSLFVPYSSCLYYPFSRVTIIF